MSKLPNNIQAIQDKVIELTHQLGLDPFEVQFEMVDYNQMSALASRGGFPTRYPHWRFGMEFDQLSKSYEYGLSKIYEMVINTDPCIAYLLNANPLGDQKLVIAHVYGHSDFFKNNMWFSKTNRSMIDKMANHATRVRRHMDQVGVDVVENFIDSCLSLENLIDPHLPFQETIHKGKEEEAGVKPTVFEVPQYLDRYVNPPELIKKEQESIDAKKQEQKERFPIHPQRDCLKFLLDYAPLEAWQQDIIDIVREEAYYYAPQGQTKIMNEGWASFWHSLLMTHHLLDDKEVLAYADHHAATLAMTPGGPINPYKIGIELFRDIEDRWNRGAFGAEYDACQSYEEKAKWNKDLGKGREKLFEVRKTNNDISFISNFLTEEFCRKHKLFVFAQNTKNHKYEIVSRAFHDIKKQLLFSLTNMGQPIIDVIDGNYKNRNELLLKHRFESHELDLLKAEQTLRNLFKIWTRPVNITTVVQGQVVTCTFDGESFVIHGLPDKSPEQK